MPNHVHLILNPADGYGLALALSRTHRLYAGYVNARARQTGHRFQGRFGSVAIDEEHLINAARYVALNPVRARLAARARDWPYSSVRAHLAGRDDALVSVRPLLDRAPRFVDLIKRQPDMPLSGRCGAPNGSAAPSRGGVCRRHRETPRPLAGAGQTRPQAAQKGAVAEDKQGKTGVSP